MEGLLLLPELEVLKDFRMNDLQLCIVYLSLLLPLEWVRDEVMNTLDHDS